MKPLSQQEIRELIDFHRQIGNKTMIEYIRRMIAEVQDLRDRQAQSMFMHDLEERL